MKAVFSKIKKVKNKKGLIISIIILFVAAGGFFAYSAFGKKKDASASEYASAKVTRGDIALKISGSGTVEPIARYEIIALVRGEILSCGFEEGDFVNEGDILYRIDSTDMQNTIQKQHNNIAKTQLTAKTNAENIENLTVRAPISGTLTDFRIKKGDTVRADGVGTITNNNTFIATVPFNASQLSQIEVGDSATIVSALYMSTLSGAVTYKSNVSSASADGSALYNVEIELKNPGALSSGISVGATIHTNAGDVKSAASGTIKSAETTEVIPKVSGKVTTVFVRDNQSVKQGDILFQIDDTEYRQAQQRTNLELQDLQLSLQSYIKELENYNIKAPIGGIVISKQYKTGDTIGGSQNSSATLMTIANTTAMVFNLDVDELEISNVEVGQTADITADALPGQSYSGKVTKIAKEGVSQNGVTTYKVELTIDQPESLISGMNVNAEIIIKESKNTLLVPVSAVSGIRNSQGTVTVKTALAEGKNGNEPSRRTESRQNAAEGERQTAPRQNAAEGERQTAPSDNNGSQRGQFASSTAGQPTNNNGYTMLRVTVGISNNDYVEIIDGLNEGDEVFYSSALQSNQNSFGRGGMNMGGGMPMGGGGVRVQSSGGSNRYR